ncbi:hypothetical protein GCM10022221_64680 [Actinocorallia aurea]
MRAEVVAGEEDMPDGLCGDPLEGYTALAHRAAADERRDASAHLPCPHGTRLLGTAAWAVQTGEVVGRSALSGLTLTGAFPDESLAHAVVSAARHPDLADASTPWAVGGVGFCAIVLNR